MLSFLSCDTSSEKLACLATISIAGGVFLSDAGTAIAALGLLGSVLNNRDLVTCYLLLTPLSFVSDLIWLFTGHTGKLGFALAIVLLAVKAAGTFYAYDVFSSTDAGDPVAADYQPFGGAPSPTRDPFHRFAQQGAPHQQQPSLQPLPTGVEPRLPPMQPDQAQAPGQ